MSFPMNEQWFKDMTASNRRFRRAALRQLLEQQGQLDRIEAKLAGLRAPHVHVWEDRDLGDGKVRAVCSGCGVIGTMTGNPKPSS